MANNTTIFLDRYSIVRIAETTATCSPHLRIYGSLAQANYAAGCTFQDALARHRTVSAAIAGQTRTERQQDGENKSADLFREAVGIKVRAALVVAALVKRLARSLGVTADDIDDRRPLSDSGVDSLLEIELRNLLWQHLLRYGGSV
ncbi:hypothetical protein F5X96DRAFT_666666 [Biscogniauxia mediterranea]|nr:hypothetical protein F5X96DRAFT_666666 [Biscogniauxia mediterranea]